MLPLQTEFEAVMRDIAAKANDRNDRSIGLMNPLRLYGGVLDIYIASVLILRSRPKAVQKERRWILHRKRLRSGHERMANLKANNKLWVNRDIFAALSAAREVEFEEKLQKIKN